MATANKTAGLTQTDILVTMAGEIAEATEILRPHHPQDSETELRHRAEGLRAKRYQTGCWPHDETPPAPMDAEPPKRKPGRPKGSKNQPKAQTSGPNHASVVDGTNE